MANKANAEVKNRRTFLKEAGGLAMGVCFLPTILPARTHEISGHLVMGDETGTVITLDLRDTPDLVVGTGHILNPVLMQNIIHELQVTVEQKQFVDFRAKTDLWGLPLPLKDHSISYGNLPRLKVTVYQPNPARKFWAGYVVSEKSGKRFTFHVEEGGPPGPIYAAAAVPVWLVIVIVGIFVVVCAYELIMAEVRRCEETAIRVCGPDKVESVKAEVNLLHGCAVTCEYHCMD